MSKIQTILIIIVGTYLAVAYVNMDLNPYNWEAFSRYAHVVLVVFVLIPIAVYKMESGRNA